jgi:general secretion pathway protein H
MRRARGFTLIEVMIVLSIIAVVATTLTLNIGSRRGPDDELERLRRVLEAVAERAQIRGTPMRLEFVGKAYRISSFDTRGNWTPVRGEAPFSDHEAPDLTWIGLTINGQAAPAKLVFGSVMPDFVLRVTTPTSEVRFSGLPTGTVQLLTERML